MLEETSTVELEPTGDSWLVHGRVVIPFAAVVFEKYGHHRLVLMVGSSVTAEYPIIVTDSPGY